MNKIDGGRKERMSEWRKGVLEWMKEGEEGTEYEEK